MDDTVTKIQELSFEIITSAGEAKSFAYEAMAAATAEANQTMDLTFSILLVHAQDHLMTTMTSIELIKEISELYLNGI